jgi:pimeloyl-ACP methyl ester carboxylesterase
VRVLDAVGLKTPVVVGHSFAGEEMHVLGARHPTRISGLVYVDAAFDRGDDADTEAFNAVARTVPAAPRSHKRRTARPSPALRAYLEKYGGAGPDAHLRARWVANPDGTIARMYAPDRAIIQVDVQGDAGRFKPYKPEPIRVPVVSIYAVPKSAD